ncbi:hypothetical protein ACQKP8_22950 [Photobacterium alginatilyticum]|uniref:hypothetical protein n=1 Tax=Photobacterium alginatilyticum TaxID=1775171 RepID=UPI004067B050
MMMLNKSATLYRHNQCSDSGSDTAEVKQEVTQKVNHRGHTSTPTETKGTLHFSMLKKVNTLRPSYSSLHGESQSEVGNCVAE